MAQHKQKKIEEDRVKTGIQGFDNIISGGLVKDSINLISGGPGTGKTILCLQFLHNGARHYNERGIYVSFEENEEQLKADVEKLGLHFDDLQDKTKFIYLPLWPEDISKMPSVLNDEIASFNAKRVVIDSISALSLPFEDDYERRKQIFRVRQILKKANVTTLVTSEVPADGFGEDGTRLSKYDIEEYICDSVIVLHYAGIGGEGDRAISVVKMRRTNHVRGPVPMSISQQGLTVKKVRR